jgi:hypothetical protein
MDYPEIVQLTSKGIYKRTFFRIIMPLFVLLCVLLLFTTLIIPCTFEWVSTANL